MFHWGWKFPHLRRVSAADCRCCCTDEHWTYREPCSRHTNSKVRTLHNTWTLVCSRILSPLLVHRSHSRHTVWKAAEISLLIFTAEKFKSCTSHAGMWNVSSGKTWARQTQRLFWQGGKPCQSRHSSVNSCLILCWKLLGAGSTGRQEVKGCVNDNPPTAGALSIVAA